MTEIFRQFHLFRNGCYKDGHICVVIHILVLLMATFAACTQKKDPLPNIVFFMTDDQGYGDVGYMGHPHLKTPNIDEMAQNGLRLDRFYAAAPICSPTRASVLTGRHPHRSGGFLYGNSLRPQEQTVIGQMSQAGYQTGFFGKWHLGSVRAGEPTSPGAHGFEVWTAAPNFYMNDPWMSRNGVPVQLEGESSAVTVDLALDFIEAAVKEDAPFIVFIWTGAPHTPHEALPELRALYPDQPDNLQSYYGEISGIDNAVGRVRGGLRNLGIAGNTLFWFTSDNGGRLPEADNGGLRGEKGELWEGGIRVPSVLEWPGQIEPRVNHIPASTVDLFPTFLELAGMNPTEPGHPRDGISLVPLINGKMDNREEPLGFWHHRLFPGQIMRSDQIVQDLDKYLEGDFAEEDLNEGLLNSPDQPYEGIEAYPDHAAWIHGDWKLHQTDSAFELYNLASDPAEEHNTLEQHPERARRMQEALRSWQDSVINSLRGGDY